MTRLSALEVLKERHTYRTAKLSLVQRSPTVQVLQAAPRQVALLVWKAIISTLKGLVIPVPTPYQAVTRVATLLHAQRVLRQD